jgi:hypothetical protein
MRFKKKGGRDVEAWLKWYSSKHKAQNSNPSTTRKKKSPILAASKKPLGLLPPLG